MNLHDIDLSFDGGTAVLAVDALTAALDAMAHFQSSDEHQEAIALLLVAAKQDWARKFRDRERASAVPTETN